MELIYFINFDNSDSRTLRSGNGLTNYHQDLRNSDRNTQHRIERWVIYLFTLIN